MEKKLQEIRDNCYQMLLKNPKMKEKSPEELEKIADTLIHYSQIMYISLFDRSVKPA